MSDYQKLYVEGSFYETNYTVKYEKRKPFERNDIRKLRAIIPGTILETCLEE